jgi:uncharacterized protein
VTPRAKRRVLSVLREAVAIYLVALLLTWAFQRRLLYPARGRGDGPAPPDAELRTLSAEDGVPVHTLVWPAPTGSPTVVLFHGNGEVIGENVGIARILVAKGLGVALVEYRGYGCSSAGSPTEAGLYADAEAALTDLETRGVGPKDVVLWGVSLGTGVAAEMAKRGRGSALVLVSPYTSMGDVAASHVFWLPARLLLRDRFETLSKAGAVQIPTLVLHGTDDEVVPFSQGRRVADAIHGAQLIEVPGGHHNDLFVRRPVAYLDELAAFAKSVRSR